MTGGPAGEASALAGMAPIFEAAQGVHRPPGAARDVLFAKLIEALTAAGVRPALTPRRIRRTSSCMQLTIPNALTIGRVAAAPVVAFVFLLFARPAADLIAFTLFTVAGLSDFFDGWLARRWGQVSAFGRMLDPIADKAMIAVTGAVLLALYGLVWIVTIPITVILLRETLVSGLREYLKGAKVLDVTLLAKWKTTAQMAAFGALLLAGAIPILATLGFVLLWVAAALTAFTGYDYFAKGIAHIRRQETL